MTAPVFVSPWFRPLDSAGAIMPGAKLIFYVSETTTPTDVYSDGDLSTALGNEVLADASGRFAPFYLDPRVLYRVQLYDADDVLQPDGDVDPLIPAAGTFIGEVKMFDGDIGDIPAGWAVCDGTGGTIDTRDRHPRGVGSGTDLGEVGGSTDITGDTAAGGGHDHGGATDEHALIVDEIPAHTHAQDNYSVAVGSVTRASAVWTADTTQEGSADTDSTGGGLGHAHDIPTEPDHVHSLSGGSVISPFFGIYFIKFVGA